MPNYPGTLHTARLLSRVWRNFSLCPPSQFLPTCDPQKHISLLSWPGILPSVSLGLWFQKPKNKFPVNGFSFAMRGNTTRNKETKGQETFLRGWSERGVAEGWGCFNRKNRKTKISSLSLSLYLMKLMQTVYLKLSIVITHLVWKFKYSCTTRYNFPILSFFSSIKWG